MIGSTISAFLHIAIRFGHYVGRYSLLLATFFHIVKYAEQRWDVDVLKIGNAFFNMFGQSTQNLATPGSRFGPLTPRLAPLCSMNLLGLDSSLFNCHRTQESEILNTLENR